MLRILLVIIGLGLGVTPSWAQFMVQSRAHTLKANGALPQEFTLQCGHSGVKVDYFISPKLSTLNPQMRHMGFIVTGAPGGPFMVLSPEAADFTDPLSRFIKEHECQHLLQNHFGKTALLALQHAASPKVHRSLLHQKELQSDCGALITLTRNGDVEAVQAAFAFLKRMNVPDKPSHPGSRRRLAALKACAASRPSKRAPPPSSDESPKPSSTRGRLCLALSSKTVKSIA